MCACKCKQLHSCMAAGLSCLVTLKKLFNSPNAESRLCVVRALASMEKRRQNKKDEQFPKYILSCKRENKFSR